VLNEQRKTLQKTEHDQRRSPLRRSSIKNSPLLLIQPASNLPRRPYPRTSEYPRILTPTPPLCQNATNNSPDDTRRPKLTKVRPPQTETAGPRANPSNTRTAFNDLAPDVLCPPTLRPPTAPAKPDHHNHIHGPRRREPIPYNRPQHTQSEKIGRKSTPGNTPSRTSTGTSPATRPNTPTPHYRSTRSKPSRAQPQPPLTIPKHHQTPTPPNPHPTQPTKKPPHNNPSTA